MNSNRDCSRHRGLLASKPKAVNLTRPISVFTAVDTNHDCLISGAEFLAWYKAKNPLGLNSVASCVANASATDAASVAAELKAVAGELFRSLTGTAKGVTPTQVDSDLAKWTCVPGKASY